MERSWLHMVLVILWIIIFFEVIFGYHYLFYEKPCETEQCFLQRAARCAPALYETKMKTAHVRFRILLGCGVEKTVLSLDANEKPETQSLFSGTSMICSYTRESYDPTMVLSLVGNLDRCTGDLQEIISWM